MIDSKKKSFVIQVLRRASYRWVGRWTAEKRTRVGRNQYKCESCGNIFTKKETQIDHVTPIVDPEKGFTNFDDYIDRMFCDEQGFQRLCIPCHDEKTTKENGTRYKVRAKKKAAKKKVDKP